MTEPLPSGLYEVLVTEVLAEQLVGIEGRLAARTDGVRSAEVADRVALHLSRLVERAIEGVGDEDRVVVAIAVARDLVARLDGLVAARARPPGVLPERPVEPGEVLRSITARRPDRRHVVQQPLVRPGRGACGTPASTAASGRFSAAPARTSASRSSRASPSCPQNARSRPEARSASGRPSAARLAHRRYVRTYRRHKPHTWCPPGARRGGWRGEAHLRMLA